MARAGTESAVQIRQRAEQTAAGLPALLVAAQRVATTVQQGLHGRRQAGPGETFWQFRRYQPGDPATDIDWRQSAKSQPLYIREQEWEAAQTVWVWPDQSPSMAFASGRGGESKAARTRLLALALCALLLRGGERVALLGGTGRPARGSASLGRLAEQLLQPSDPDESPASLPPPSLLPRHGHVVLISDFLSPLPDLGAATRQFIDMGIAGHMMHIIDPAEENLPYAGRVRFTGLEREGTTIIGRVEAARDEYSERFTAHIAGLTDIARQAGWSFVSHRIDRPAETALLSLFLALSGHIDNRY